MEPDSRSEKCKEMFSLLSEYLNLELPPETCAEMEAHLSGCSHCIEFTESLRKTIDLCRQYPPAELPAPMGEQARKELLDAWQRMLAARKPGVSPSDPA
jgi:RNA polymerase sigma-70 factor, ECF subfamily